MLNHDQPLSRKTRHSESRTAAWRPARLLALMLTLVLALTAAGMAAACASGTPAATTTVATGGMTTGSAPTNAPSQAGATQSPGTTPATTIPGTTPATTIPGTAPTTAKPGTTSATTIPGTPPTTVIAGTTQATTAPVQPAGDPPSAAHPVIALTFDDGPSQRDTGKLLDLLKAEQVTATFFVLGNQIDAGRESLVQRAFSEGHEIGNHTYTHSVLKKMSPEKVREEFQKTSGLIERITGRKPTIARPPTGAYDDNVIAVSKELGLSLVNWSYQSCPEDWNHRGEPDYIADFVVSKAANGHIVLLHDTNSSTVESMAKMIKGLKARGFRFMTVSQLLAFGGAGEPTTGKVYFQYTPKK